MVSVFCQHGGHGVWVAASFWKRKLIKWQKERGSIDFTHTLHLFKRHNIPLYFLSETSSMQPLCNATTIHSCSWWKSGHEHVMWMWYGTLGTMLIWFRADDTYELGHVACRNANCWHYILLSRLQNQPRLLKPGCISIRFEMWLLEMHIMVKYRSKMRVTSVIKAKCWVWTDPLRHHLWW